MQASGVCLVRQRVRQVRSLQAVLEEVEVERPGRVGRGAGQQIRGIVAQLDTALAILTQYTSSGGGTIDPASFQTTGLETQGGGNNLEEHSGAQATLNTRSAQWISDVGHMEPPSRTSCVACRDGL